jgi:predicted nucleic acid-binding protein
MANVDALLSLPNVQSVGEHDRFWQSFRDAAAEAAAGANLVSDAHVVALMLENGVRTMWTQDRDFRRFPTIDVRDPFASAGGDG